MTRSLHVGLMLISGLAWCLFTTQSAQAQVNAGVLFLRIAPGARAAGMGEAFVAMADDATATHWNPAGLGGYPLNSEWNEFDLTISGHVLDAVPIKNGLPVENYKGYDLWVLTDEGLGVFRFGETHSSAGTIELSTEGVRSITAAIRRYAPFLDEADAEEIARRVAAVSVGIDAEEIAMFMERVKQAIPSEYRDRTIMENIVREMGVAHREGRLIVARLDELRAAIDNLPESGPAEVLQLDRIRFAIEHSISKSLPASITVSIDELVHPPVRAISGVGERLYVVAANGLLQFDGRRWSEILPPDDLEWEDTNIHTLAVAAGGRLWLGTDDGILVRHSGQWQSLGAEQGLPEGRVTKLAISGSKSGWVYGDFGLARYDGTNFTTSLQVTVNVGDSLSTVLARVLGTDDAVFVNRLIEDVRAINGLAEGEIPEAGTTILIPYELGLRGDVTALELDQYRRLWVGTSLGAFRFTRGQWRSYGYQAMTMTEASTASEVAAERLGRHATPERIARLADYIIAYNQLDGSDIPAGRTIYVYRNPAGAPVRSIAKNGNTLFIATEVGQLQVKSGAWSRYYHAGLDHDDVRAITVTGGDAWFVTDDRVVIYQRAQKEFSLMHAPWLPEFNLDLYFEYFTYVTNIEGLGTFGGAITFLSYGEIPRLDEFGNVINLFHSFDLAASISYGTRVSPNVTAGLTAKVIYSRLADQGAGEEIGSGSATAFALDAGFIYRTPWRRLRLGGVLSNVGPDISYIDAQQSDPLPRNLALGLAYKFWDSPFNTLTLVFDLNKELVDLGDGASDEFQQIIYNFGAEYWYASSIAIRFGYINDEDGQIKTITAGIGLALQSLRIDVSYIPSQDNLPLSNTVRYSFTGRF